MSASQALIVFSQVPEHLDFYLVDLESKQAAAAQVVAGKFIGMHDLTEREERAFTALNNWFATTAGQAVKQEHAIFGANIKSVFSFGIIL